MVPLFRPLIIPDVSLSLVDSVGIYLPFSAVMSMLMIADLSR
jgi:hypothetical protein